MTGSLVDLALESVDLWQVTILLLGKAEGILAKDCYHGSNQQKDLSSSSLTSSLDSPLELKQEEGRNVNILSTSLP